MSNIIYNTGVKFPSLIIPTGSQPLDSRTIVQNLPTNKSEFTDGAVYLGMTVSCLNDKNFYMLTKVASDGALTWQQVGRETDLSNYYTKDEAKGLFNKTVSTEKDLIDFATTDTIGQQVYLTQDINDGDTVKYSTGLYVVTGVNSVSKLAASSLVEQDLSSLSTRITNIQTTISGLDASYTAGNGQFIKSIEQTDGKISSVTYADLPKIGEGDVTAYLTSYTYLEGSVIDNRASIQVTTNGGKVTGVNLEKFGNLVTKEYVDHMHNVLLGDGHLAETLDTIKEISYWLDKNPSDAANLTLSLVELTQKVENDGRTVASAINAINDKFSSYATIAYVEQEINNVYSYVNSRLSWDVI